MESQKGNGNYFLKTEILDLKNKLSKINLLHGFSRKLEIVEESVTLKVDQNKLSNVKVRE